MKFEYKDIVEFLERSTRQYFDLELIDQMVKHFGNDEKLRQWIMKYYDKLTTYDDDDYILGFTKNENGRSNRKYTVTDVADKLRYYSEFDVMMFYKLGLGL